MCPFYVFIYINILISTIKSMFGMEKKYDEKFYGIV